MERHSLHHGAHQAKSFATVISTDAWSGDTVTTAVSSSGTQNNSSRFVASTKSPPSAQATATGTSANGGVAYHRFHREEQLIFTHINDQAEWGDWIYATEQVAGLTFSNGVSDTAARQRFIDNGSLSNARDSNYRAINNEYPVFAFSIDYGKIGSTSQSSLFTITLAQEQAIQFKSSLYEVQSLPPLWTSWYPNELDLVSSIF